MKTVREIPRFMQEYADFQKQNFEKGYPSMEESYRLEKIEYITRTLNLYKRGMFTIDEAMHTLATL